MGVVDGKEKIVPEEFAPSVATYSETAALWMLMQGDRGRAQAILDAMTPRERAEFTALSEELSQMLSATFLRLGSPESAGVQ
jgi:hypothetical protein